jgi:predicted alpha/beta-fold hydrolase
MEELMDVLFRPLPLLGNPHVQTLLGTLLPTPAGPPARERRVRLPDGDQLVLHDSAAPTWRPGGRMALLIHGLGGSHRSGSIRRVAARLAARGFRVGRLDLRGAGRGAGLARRSYHGGCSADVRAAAEAMHRWSPNSPLALVGLSLGGNIVLKLAGEAAELPVPGLECVAALAPPVDLIACAALLAAPGNRFYERFFVRGLLAQVRRQRHFFPDLPMPRFPPRPTLRVFDDLYTAPCGGFADALDYYRRASALPLLGRIAVPTFILAARDDPFIAAGPLESLPPLAGRQVLVVPRGGHLGFLGWDGAGGFRWAERQVVEWLWARRWR